MYFFLRAMVLSMLILPTNAIAENVFESVVDSSATKENAENDIFSFFDESIIRYFQKAKIIVMNKITANSKEFDLTVGSSVSYGSAELQLLKCANTTDLLTGSMMLVTLKDTRIKEDITTIFSGWIFSKSPSLSAVEHPVYQLLAVSCS